MKTISKRNCPIIPNFEKQQSWVCCEKTYANNKPFSNKKAESILNRLPKSVIVDKLTDLQ